MDVIPVRVMQGRVIPGRVKSGIAWLLVYTNHGFNTDEYLAAVFCIRIVIVYCWKVRNCHFFCLRTKITDAWRDTVKL